MPRKLSVEQLETRALLAAAPAFSLVDANANSASFNQAISPADYSGEVTAWYFAHANCSYCTAQYGHIDALQQDLESTYPQLAIRHFGVNEAGFEASNAQITAGKTIPWLQDTDTNENGQSDVWTEHWKVTFRDVVILNGAGEKIDVYNLTSHNLGEAANYSELKTKLIDAAMLTQLPWHNKANPVDVNGDNHVAPLDALLIIIEMNTGGPRKLEAPTGTQAPAGLFDTNGDGFLAPLDALLVINHLNTQFAAQGEPPAATPPGPDAEQSLRGLDILALEAIFASTEDED